MAPALLRRTLTATLLAIAVLPTAHADAAITTFKPVADSYVSAGSPTTRYGASSTLKVDGSPVHNGYVRFDVGGLTEPVRRATLKLHSASTTTSGIRLHAVAENGWDEKTITYQNAPGFGAVVSTSGPFSAGQWASLDGSSLVRGNGVVSFAITTTSSSSKTLSSREGANPPQLVIETEDAPPPPPPPPPPGEDPVIAAAGDIACDPSDAAYNGGLGTASRCRQKHVSDLLTGGDLTAVLPLGDEQYENGELATFQQAYDPSWGRVRDISRPVPGNHEYGTAGAAGYFDYFNGPGNATGPAGDRDRGYYSFDIRNWHLVALNSNCSKVGGCGPGSPQEQWLRADLAAHTSTCTLAYWHHPRFSSDTRGGSAELGDLWQALYEAGADVALTGHTHAYERFARQDASGTADPVRGMRQFVVGTGGKETYGFGDVAPNSGLRKSGALGVLRLTLGSGGYEWKFASEAGQSFTDSGKDVCDGPVDDATPPSAPTGLSAARTSDPGTVELAWTASSDDDGVSEYRVHRDGAPIATTARARYTDSSAQAGTTHRYEVFAVDPSGNVSAASNPATAAAVAAGEVTFRPTDDAYVRLDAPSSSFGSATSLQVDNSPVKSFLMKFSVAGLGGKSVRGARLRLYAIDPSSRGGAFHRTADTGWTQQSVTWSTAPTADPAPIASLGPVSAGKWYEVDVTPLVQGEGVVSLRVTSSSSDGADYASKERSAALAPELIVTTE